MHRALLTPLTLSILASLAACSGAAPPDPSPTTTGDNAIIGGTKDTGDPAVVELIMDDGSGYDTCTATFISQTVLLTAAHCVVSENAPYKIPSKAKFSIMTAASGKSPTISIPRANVHPHPNYDGDAAHDVAVITLDDPVDVDPVPILRDPLDTSMIGNPVRLIGYGQAVRKSSSNDGAGTKRSVTTTLRRIEGDLVLIGNTGKQACDGDSGGPALMTIDGVETLVATDDLASQATNCVGGDLYQRVDKQLDFIDQYLGGGDGQ